MAIQIHPDLNSIQVIQVEDRLRKYGVTDYSMQPGNDCIWVTYYRRGFAMNDYYIFRDGKIVDVIGD